MTRRVVPSCALKPGHAAKALPDGETAAMCDLNRSLPSTALRPTLGVLTLSASLALAVTSAAADPQQGGDAATSREATIEMSDPAAGPRVKKKGTQSIAVLVNDEPITAYEIEQRAAFLALQRGGGGGADFKAKAEARWKSIIKDPKTQERFKQMLQKNNVQSQEEARALQTKFVKQLQADMVEQLKREMRVGALSGSKAQAQQELIEEKIKLQEAKRLNAVAEEQEVDRILTGIAERNKMTLDQFGQHMKKMGVDIKTMRNRFRAEMSWREVVRRRFGAMVSVTERDVDQLMATTPVAQANVELLVQRITLPMPSGIDQSLIAQRIADADALARQFSGCATMSGLAAGVPGAKFEDLGTRKPDTIPEPTRSLLLNATEGDLLPASMTNGGVELWALCGRKAVGGGEASSSRENAQNELRQREFEVLAQKHLKDLRQDAAIEIR
jgi:peptidyl-prolyl cis-trans isomerase SurA